MTFLAPWAMVLGALGAAGTVLLHLVARQRPAAYLLPTARFIPERQSLVSRVAARPRDLLLLACRVLLLLCAGGAFAQPVLTPHRTGRARIVMIDRSALVADPAAAWQRARTLVADVPASVLVAFDSSATVVEQPTALDSTLHATAVAPPSTGAISAALVAARRAAGTLAARADSVELVLVSPVGTAEIDSATAAVRALWPGAITIERVPMRADSTVGASLDRAVPLSDALGPALAHVPVVRSPRSTRVVRVARANAGDSAFARSGGTVVVWDSASAPLEARGLAVGDDVIVAAMGRRSMTAGGLSRARWADGAAAAVEVPLGAGCIRTIAVHAPSAGDLALRPAFQRIVRGLTAGCTSLSTSPADAATMTMLRGGTRAAPASLLGGDSRLPSRIVPWLLGAALLLALLELALRRWPAAAEASA